MSLLPISPSRTSDVLSQLRLVRQLNGDNADLEKLYDQLSTGRRVNTLSDDPAAAVSAVSLQASQEYSEQILRNSQSAEGYLNVTDTIVSEFDALLIEARGTAVSAAQTPLSEPERVALAQTLDQAIERAVAVGNQSYRGHFLLGGAIDETPPLSSVGDSVVWSGEPALQSTRISRDYSIETGVNARDALGVGAVIASSSDLQPALTRETLLADLFLGRGVTPGLARVSSGGNFTELDLRDAKTLGDLQDAVNNIQLDGRDLQFTIGANGVSVDYADGQPGFLVLDDALESNMLNQLGIESSQGLTGLPLNSFDLDPVITSNVLLSDLNDGAGIDVSAGLVIRQDSNEFVVDLAQATTIEDVLVAINISGADVEARLNESTGAIEIEGRASGVDYQVTENGGTAATALGIRSSSEVTRLADLNRGLGVTTVEGNDVIVHRTDGTSLGLDLDSLTTIGDVINAINTHVDNTGPAAVTASLRSDSNGIQLTSASGVENLRVRESNGSDAGETLGLVTAGQQETIATIEAGVAVIRGEDYAPVESGSALDTLIRLRRAVINNDIPEITRLQPKLDDHLTTATSVRAEVGFRTQNLDLMRQQTEDFNVEVAAQLSNQIDADFASVISEMTARQASLQASLQVIAQISQLTVLNFL